MKPQLKTLLSKLKKIVFWILAILGTFWVCCLIISLIIVYCSGDDQLSDSNTSDPISTIETPVSGYYNNYSYVDLGLPSGLKWATHNVGTRKVEQFGKYFAWGEIVEADEYNWDYYKFCNGSFETITKYCNNRCYGGEDGKEQLESCDDVASMIWGGSWRMPTDAEWRELHINCSWKWTDSYMGSGTPGCIMTSKKNGNSIFLPAGGYCEGKGIVLYNVCGFYWSSTLSGGCSNAQVFRIADDDVKRVNDYYYRCYGMSVRPVCP